MLERAGQANRDGAGGGAATGVRDAMSALVNHPNTPPFIVKQMIQKTTSPDTGLFRASPPYSRTTAMGCGDVGVAAGTIDPEARGAQIDKEYGACASPARTT
jgi:hypothetical protein